MFDEADVIFRYTRAQALEDGVLVDVTEMARECGFRIPVAVTARVWAEVVVPPEDARSCGQSEAGRLWDVLSVLRAMISRSGRGTDTLLYEILVADGRRRRTVKLKSICGPGDRGEPVLTILMLDED